MKIDNGVLVWHQIETIITRAIQYCVDIGQYSSAQVKFNVGVFFENNNNFYSAPKV